MFGEFLSRIVSGVEDEVPREFKLSDEEDARMMRLAIARATSPRKIQDLEKAVRKLLPTKKSTKEFPLKNLIRQVKHSHSDYSPLDIARRVDALLGKEKRNYRTLCPGQWKRYQLPGKFADILENPSSYPQKLVKNVRSYISKA